MYIKTIFHRVIKSYEYQTVLSIIMQKTWSQIPLFDVKRTSKTLRI